MNQSMDKLAHLLLVRKAIRSLPANTSITFRELYPMLAVMHGEPFSNNNDDDDCCSISTTVTGNGRGKCTMENDESTIPSSSSPSFPSSTELLSTVTIAGQEQYSNRWRQHQHQHQYQR
mmetsp:Transcript_69672/g.77947  ORF Transcript_69672/g.77947 Transcript_69672/m.77947 type:complete len:119 (-) Transcript_69672:7-363(-)